MGTPRLGIDIGSVAVHVAVTGERDETLWSASRTTGGRPLAALADLLEEADAAGQGTSFRVGLVAGARNLLAQHLPDAVQVSEVVATARGAAVLCPDALAAIEIGGQMSRWIELDPEQRELADFALSDLCAAGAGAFLEQQAGRLQLSIGELATMAADAPRGATVAGRCAVFAKSDMIHLQQKGTPVDEIAYGLCLALIRNFRASVLRGRSIRTPLAVVGGGARNGGLLRAVREVLELKDDAVRVPRRPGSASAVGAALLAVEGAPLTLDELRGAVETGRNERVAVRRLPRLPDPGVEPPPVEPAGERVVAAGRRALLGIDVGSVSTNLALVGDDGSVLDAVYLRTRGRPLQVLQEGLDQLVERHGEELRVTGVGTTGSGRHLAGRFVGADLVRNEITAQLRSSVAYLPDVDTVLEIGGQDSKYIGADAGHIRDFCMNKICAAGTGSFLEEQAERLGVSIIDEFAEHALRSDAPADLGSRCTVFMDSELVHALRSGATTDDVCAGLAMSVARNYLDKVVAGRPVGQRVLFQGGTASNRAVVSAFRQLLGRPVQVHPYNRVSGAVGAALLVLDARRDGIIGEDTAFRGFDECKGELERSFECPRCSNRCQVNRFRSGTQVFFFGDTCERYSSRGERQATEDLPEDTLATMEQLLRDVAGLPVDAERIEPDRALGIPRDPLPYALLPMWTALARAAGREPVLSSRSSPEILSVGLRSLSAETCLPIKLTYGHVQDLVDRGVTTVLLPGVLDLPPREGEGDRSETCPYTQHIPYMVRATLDANLISPQVRISDPFPEAVDEPERLAQQLGLGMDELGRAWEQGRSDLADYQRRLRELGERVLARADDRVLVLMAKPYNLLDPFLNLSLGRHLQRLGIPFLPMDALPLDDVELGPEWWDLPWGINRDYARATMIVQGDPRLFPVVLSSFGCGPDGFATKHVDELLADRPRLLLELDEHRAEAGLVTRLEAFADEVDVHLRRRRAPRRIPGAHPILNRRPGEIRRRFFLPYFADQVVAYAGALRRAGHEAIVLPLPDESTLAAGEAVASGRECHAYAYLVGDLVQLLERRQFRDGDSFYYPGGVNPCLIPQYRDSMIYAARRLIGRDVDVVTPLMDDMEATFGRRALFDMWKGLVAVDLLLRARCEYRPYETEPGRTDVVHAEQLAAVERAVEQGTVLEAMRAAGAAFSAIPVDRSRRRPRVGVAGDIYTRINEFANGALFARLEALGCEVCPPSTMVDVVDLNVARMGRRFARRWEVLGAFRFAFYGKIKDTESRRVHEAFRGAVRAGRPSTLDEILEWTAPYLGAESNALILTNVAQMLDYARGGASGVINAICFNCMVGTVSASLLDRIRADLDGLPMTTLMCGGSEGTSGAARLEAFAHQVHRHHARRRGV